MFIDKEYTLEIYFMILLDLFKIINHQVPRINDFTIINYIIIIIKLINSALIPH